MMHLPHLCKSPEIRKFFDAYDSRDLTVTYVKELADILYRDNDVTPEAALRSALHTLNPEERRVITRTIGYKEEA